LTLVSDSVALALEMGRIVRVEWVRFPMRRKRDVEADDVAGAKWATIRFWTGEV
jgi:hypothetical protein